MFIYFTVVLKISSLPNVTKVIKQKEDEVGEKGREMQDVKKL
jgi:hypothetical protein